MTAAEALETVLEATTSRKWAEAPGEIIARLRALGFVVVPVEADEAAIKRGMDEIANTATNCGMKLLCKIEGRQCGCRQAAEDAYAAMIAPDGRETKTPPAGEADGSEGG